MSILVDYFNDNKNGWEIPTDRFRLHVSETVRSIYEPSSSADNYTPQTFLGKETKDFTEMEKLFTRRILFTKQVLNVFEADAGWLKTKVYQLVDPAWEDSHVSYMFEASRRWMKSTYLLSMYLLIIRSAYSMMKDTVNCDRMIRETKTVEGYLSLLTEFERVVVPSYYIDSSKQYWQLILKSYPELWERRKMEHYWNKEQMGNAFPSHEGLHKLVCGNAADYEVNKKFEKILAKEGMGFVT
jgi:hypothetical protein